MRSTTLTVFAVAILSFVCLSMQSHSQDAEPDAVKKDKTTPSDDPYGGGSAFGFYDGSDGTADGDGGAGGDPYGGSLGGDPYGGLGRQLPPTKNTVIRVKHISARDIAPMVEKMFRGSGSLVVAEQSSNSLILNATEDQIKKINELLKAVDVPPPGSGEAYGAMVAPRNQTMTKVFALEKARADEVAMMLRELFGTDGVSIASDQTTLLVRGPEGALAEIEAIVLRLDEHAAERPAAQQVVPDEFLQMLTRGGGGRGRSGVPSADVRGLRSKYHDAERTTHETAPKLRAAKPNSAKQEQLMEQLQREVESAFDARQDLQQAEVIALTQRIATIEKSLRRRQALREQIIEKRVEQLIDDESLRWDPPKSLGTPGSGMPIGQAGPAHRPIDESIAEPPGAPVGTPRNTLKDPMLAAGTLAATDPVTVPGIDEFIRLQRDLLSARATVSKLKAELKVLRAPDPSLEIDFVRAEKEVELLRAARQIKQAWLESQRDLIAAEVAQAQAEFEHLAKLFEKGFIPKAEMMRADLKLQQLNARRGQLKSLYDLYIEELDEPSVDELGGAKSE